MVIRGVPKDFPLLAITMLRGTTRKTPIEKETLRILGLRHIHQTVYHRNNASVRGQLRKVSDLALLNDLG